MPKFYIMSPIAAFHAFSCSSRLLHFSSSRRCFSSSSHFFFASSFARSFHIRHASSAVHLSSVLPLAFIIRNSSEAVPFASAGANAQFSPVEDHAQGGGSVCAFASLQSSSVEPFDSSDAFGFDCVPLSIGLGSPATPTPGPKSTCQSAMSPTPDAAVICELTHGCADVMLCEDTAGLGPVTLSLDSRCEYTMSGC